MINVEDIINRNLKILKNIKNELNIEENLANLIFLYDRLILNQDLQQKRIRLIGVLSADPNKDLKEFCKDFKPVFKLDIVPKNTNNVKDGFNINFNAKSIKLDFLEDKNSTKKEARKQIYVLKKSIYETLNKEELINITNKLELFRRILKQTRFIKSLFDEEQFINQYMNNLLIKNELVDFKYDDFKHKISE
ncbi:hypothetical protein [Aliarcobacter butzleri]|uniref:hypothetical protein n=1 Tax=Aliarcobacter butzleri TaxID=28197 RepID=UPI002B243837|nr:hypothetical protein [Aliarcobacter butzleri]